MFQNLIYDISAEHLIADQSLLNYIIDQDDKRSYYLVILSKRNRKFKRNVDTYLYSLQHIIENTFLKFKQCRGSLFVIIKIGTLS